MENLYLILDSNDSYNQIAFELLKKSAEERGVCAHLVDVDQFDFSKPIKLTKKDGMYKISSRPEASLIERFLVNPDVSNFYSNYLFCVGRLENVVGSSLLHEKYQLPIIKTIFSITDDRVRLKNYVDYLGGFPVIIKSAWQKHGEGVMKIDSFDSLVSVSGYLSKQAGLFVMREFIPHKKQARLIVLGDKVIASHENLTAIDFRSNVGTNDERQRRVMVYDEQIQAVAVKAVSVLNYEFGGVDILFDERTGEPYIAEVNFPCFFPTTQRLTGVDIAGAMVDYLVGKGRG